MNQRSESMDTDRSYPSHFLCPHTQELMNEPHTCRFCKGSAERSSFIFLGYCPLCRSATKNNFDFTLNTDLQNEIARWLSDARRPSPQDQISSRKSPLTAFMIGRTGVGKSTTINSIAHRTVTQSSARASAVTLLPSVVFDEFVESSGVYLRLIDAPGLFDPQTTNEKIFEQITSLFQKGVDGFDAFFHIMEMGRITEEEIAMPMILLHGLGANPAERAQLIRRYRIIVTWCDSSNDEGETTHDKIVGFKAALRCRYPLEIAEAIDNAIFIENNSRLRSEYNNKEEIREKVVNQLKKCRGASSTYYRPQLISNVAAALLGDLQSIVETHLSDVKLNDLTMEELISLQNFFHFISESRCWNPPRVTDNLPAVFIEKWNEMNLVVRDRLAVNIANAVVTKVKVAVRTITLAEKKKREEERAREIQEAEARGRAQAPIQYVASTGGGGWC